MRCDQSFCKLKTGRIGKNRVMGTRNFIRAIQQLNYTRHFLSANRVKVVVPDGIPYEAFDNTGKHVSVSSLLQLIESTQVFSFFTMPHLGQPDSSLVDGHRLMEKCLVFSVSYRLDISREFHEISSPKYPLEVEQIVDYAGKSSMRLSSVMKHADIENPYAICKSNFVFVDVNTRKSSPFPEWWKEKYGHVTVGGEPLILKSLPEPEVNNEHVCNFPLTVFPSDNDSYGHTSWPRYAKFCADACSFGIMNKKFLNIKENSLENGLRYIEVAMKKESKAGDILDVVSWESSDVGGSFTINNIVKNGRSVCAEAVLLYFDE